MPCTAIWTNSSRTETLEKFKRGETTLLVCSDVAARGLDVEAMSHVFNFDAPFHADDYVHRIGRTGRAGRSGTAYTFVTPEDGEHIEDIEKLIKKSITREVLENLPEPNAEQSRRSSSTRGPDRNRRQGARHKPASSHHQPAKSHAPSAPPKAAPPPRRQFASAPVADFGDDNHLPAFLRKPVSRVKV